jgi:hypothetical protein
MPGVAALQPARFALGLRVVLPTTPGLPFSYRNPFQIAVIRNTEYNSTQNPVNEHCGDCSLQLRAWFPSLHWRGCRLNDPSACIRRYYTAFKPW